MSEKQRGRFRRVGRRIRGRDEITITRIQREVKRKKRGVAVGWMRIGV